MSGGLKGMDEGVDVGGRLVRRRSVVVCNLCEKERGSVRGLTRQEHRM